ncbi:MTH1187 family thiamine-binding protein [bacterium]|nr:MTH1187 family thiamine-binding protein [bacterium]
MAILDLTVSPKKRGVESFRESVAIAEEVIRTSGLPNMLTPMSTIIEGELDELLDLMKKIDEALIEAGHYRVYIIAKIDHRVDKTVRMMDKVEAVEAEIRQREGS